MASAIKKTTNLCNLAVCPNPHARLKIMYDRILKILSKMPEKSAYRKHTEEVIKHRALIVKNTRDVRTLEDQINCGQAEELIIQADKELELARRFLIYRPWETLKTDIPKGQWAWPPN